MFKIILSLFFVSLLFSCWANKEQNLPVEKDISMIEQNETTKSWTQIEWDVEIIDDKYVEEASEFDKLFIEADKAQTKEEQLVIEKKLIKYYDDWSKDMRLYTYLGRIYSNIWEYDKAITILEEANNLSEKKEWSIFFRLGSLYIQKWEIKKAEEYLLEAKKLIPEWTKQYEDLLKRIEDLSKWNESKDDSESNDDKLKSWDGVVNIDSEKAYTEKLEYINKKLKEELTKEDYLALEKELLALESKEFKVSLYLWNVYFMLDEYDKGIEILEEANNLSKVKDPWILFDLWMLYLRKWEEEKAKDYLLQAKDITPVKHLQYLDLVNTIKELENK